MGRQSKVERPVNSDSALRRLSLDPTDPAFYQNPYPAFEAMRAAGPAVFWEQLGLWCLTGYDDVNAVLRDKRFGREILHVATREEVGIAEPPEHVRPFYEIDDLSMLSREPPVHTRLRALVNRAFVSRQIERLRPRVATLANELIDRLVSRAASTSSPPSPRRSPSPSSPSCSASRSRQRPSFSTGRTAWWRCTRPAATAPTRTRAVAATHAFVAFLRDYVGKRRKAPRDDLISHLISAEAAGERLSEDELISGCIQLLNAGHEATVHALGNAVKAILDSGLDPAQLFASGETTAATVEETLRFDPPLHFFDRYALEPVEIAGVEPAGRARRSASSSAPPTAIPRAGRTPAASIRPGRSFPMSPSAPASISASARRSPGLRCRWRCRSSSRGCPA